MTLPEPAFPLASARPESAPAEADLVIRARRGDAAALDHLAHAHRNSLYLFALQLTADRDDALDVTQEGMLRFFRQLHRFDPGRPVRPWLFQIVRNCVHDLRRRRKVRRAESLDEERDGSPRREIVDPHADPERDARRNQLQRRLWESLRELTASQREILVLRDYQDLSYAEIAAALAIPIGTVMSRLHGARKRLRELLHEDLRALAHDDLRPLAHDDLRALSA